MSELATVGIDLAKSVFQIHGVDEDGRVLVRRQLRRSQLLAFFEKQPRCLIGMEACGGTHDWGRRIQELGHDVRLMPPSSVKPYVKCGKTDAADAAAICEAVTRPSMRFVAVKSEACSSGLVVHRTRDLLVRQRTQVCNAIRAHMTEFGVIAAKGAQNVERLRTQLHQLPEVARLPVSLLFEQLAHTDTRIERLTREIEAAHAQSETSQRLARDRTGCPTCWPERRRKSPPSHWRIAWQERSLPSSGTDHATSRWRLLPERLNERSGRREVMANERRGRTRTPRSIRSALSALD